MLRSWRELLAAPLPEAPKEGPEKNPGGNSSDKSDNRTNTDLLRVELSETVLGQIAETSDKLPRQRLIQTGPTTWVEAEWCRALCVFCDRPALDVIACAEHRAKIDAIVMPWSEPS
jgi:hypothetical protein